MAQKGMKAEKKEGKQQAALGRQPESFQEN